MGCLSITSYTIVQLGCHKNSIVYVDTPGWSTVERGTAELKCPVQEHTEQNVPSQGSRVQLTIRPMYPATHPRNRRKQKLLCGKHFAHTSTFDNDYNNSIKRLCWAVTKYPLAAYLFWDCFTRSTILNGSPLMKYIAQPCFLSVK